MWGKKQTNIEKEKLIITKVNEIDAWKIKYNNDVRHTMDMTM